jgi:branched-chain amino acid transport system substrate-binding protein
VPRAAAAIALSGRYAQFGRQAAAGLRAWADWAGASLTIEDDGSEPARSARLTSGLARGADIVFGPYGSGPARAVAEAMEGRPEVVWNHGGAEVPRRAARLVDVLGPAGAYWRGLPAVLGTVPVAVVRAPGGFGRSVALGAERALAAAGSAPVTVRAMEVDGPAGAAREALAAGAEWVVGGGRAEDDLALARELLAAGLRGALVVCGVELAARELGDAIAGWLGPAQWAPGGPPPPVPLPPDADYPAAQAVAAGQVALRALELAGSARPDAVWDAARALETSTFLGPFKVDAEGRQVAHAPLIVRWEGRGAGLRRAVVWRPGAPEPWQTPPP